MRYCILRENNDYYAIPLEMKNEFEDLISQIQYARLTEGVGRNLMFLNDLTKEFDSLFSKYMLQWDISHYSVEGIRYDG